VPARGVTNGAIYQAGVSDQGNNDKITANRISGAGYDPNTIFGATFFVDADPANTNRRKGARQQVVRTIA
jgi:hypothetical protein